VEGVVRDFNKNGVADSEQRYSFPVRQAIFVLLPPVENPNPHILGRSSQTSVQHRVVLEFLGKLIIDLLGGLCRADR